ncbi:asparagine synthetase B, partial [candidate division KSB1 bacterium]
MKFRQILIFFLIFISQVRAQKLLIPMDLTQTDHLKSYGVAYHTL